MVLTSGTGGALFSARKWGLGSGVSGTKTGEIGITSAGLDLAGIGCKSLNILKVSIGVPGGGVRL